MTVDVQRITDTPARAAARLCNFATSQSELSPGHQLYLMTEFKTAMQTFKSPWVEIVGYASRRGTSAGNLRLSRQRMQAVGLFIANMGVSCEFVKAIGRGSEESGEDSNDNSGYYRAVEVYVYGTKPAPRPEPPAEVKPEENVYALRVIQSQSIGVGPVQTEVIAFEIGNVARKIASKFVYGAVGVTAQIPFAPPVGAGQVGPWSFFLTDRSTPLTTFQAFANITTEPGATFDKHSVAGDMYLEFLNLSDNDGDIRVKASPIKFGGGDGFSAPSGGAVTGGRMVMVGKLFRFNPKSSPKKSSK